MSKAHKSISIYCENEELSLEAKKLAYRLNLPLCLDKAEACDFVLLCTHAGLMLKNQQNNQNPVLIDFTSGKTAYRRLHGGGKNQAIAKAVGIKPHYRPSVIDTTAGLGQDSFVLASLGCPVFMIERSPIIAALLEDALLRAKMDPDTREITQKMQLYNGEAKGLIPQLPEVDVIYLDPMFPDSKKSALSKREMQVLHELVGVTNENDLLDTALKYAKKRVVVKRPKNGPLLNNRSPSLQMLGSSNRFDIYLI